MSENKCVLLGLMSGTSLDGLDMALVEFSGEIAKWNYRFIKTQTLSYPDQLARLLSASMSMNGNDLMLLDVELGIFMGEQVRSFLQGVEEQPSCIASHGHTVFHQPEKRLTCQIGNGNHIAARSGIDTICDFRSLDVALHGQGAPLVPIGDHHLFSEYGYCLNLGGFSNVSFQQEGLRLAYDICPVNIVLNELCNKYFQLPFDCDGEIGRRGAIYKALFDELEQLPYYQEKAPKSLGREWLENCFIPIVNQYEIPPADKLRTLYAHIASQIGRALAPGAKVLLTGGGAHNIFLVDCIKAQSDAEIILPEKQLIDYKEALLFAFLGYLRIKGIPNTLKSVTGSSVDSCGGVYIKKQT